MRILKIIVYKYFIQINEFVTCYATHSLGIRYACMSEEIYEIARKVNQRKVFQNVFLHVSIPHQLKLE